jgi:hypothetical protein
MGLVHRYRLKTAAVVLILLAFPAARGAGSDRVVVAELPSLVAALEEVSGVDFCGEPVPLYNPDVRERFEKEMLVSLWRRPQVLLWLKRSDRYLPVIEKILAELGMPDDLKYIAVIESALRPHAGSRKGAIGFWQFLAPTARHYGLTVDARRDERRNIFDSTRAAAAYFTELYQLFESWTLAAAAYNMGEERLEAEIIEQGADTYYDLYLPLETQRYVLRAVAAKLILAEPERYGFFLPAEARWAPLSFERMSIECERETPIRIVAAAAGTTFKRIKDLNPEIRGHYLQKGPADIRVPVPVPVRFDERFRQLQADYIAEQNGRVYVVKKGDNLTIIAERFEVSLSALLIWNGLDPRGVIHPGDRLVIYPDAEKLEEDEIGEETADEP